MVVNWVDVLIVVMVGGPGFLGWRNGVLHWAITLAGVIVGVVLAGRFYTSLAPVLTPVTDAEGLRQVLAFSAIFLLILLGAWLVAKLVKGALSSVLWVDHLAGLALGMAAGATGAAAIITAMGALPVAVLTEAVGGSALATPLVRGLGVVRSLLPAEFDRITDLL